MKKLCLAAGALLLAGCGEVIDVRESTVNYQGESYPVRTETVRSGGRTYDVSRVRVGARTEQCIIDSPGDCEAAAARAKMSPDLAR
jgi:hypothetical protein